MIRDMNIDSSIPTGGTVGTTPELIFGQSKLRSFLDISNRSSSNWLYVFIRRQGEPGEGMGVPPESARSWDHITGDVYLCADAADTPYSASAGES